MKKFGIKEAVAAGIGIVVFAALTKVSIPFFIVPGTSYQIRSALLALLAAMFGPAVGAITGLVGHIAGDMIFCDSISWANAIPEAVFGLVVGLFAGRFMILKGGFGISKLFLFNVIQVMANAVAWVFVSPILNLLINRGSGTRIFAQGAVACFTNSILCGVFASLLAILCSWIVRKRKQS